MLSATPLLKSSVVKAVAAKQNATAGKSIQLVCIADGSDTLDIDTVVVDADQSGHAADERALHQATPAPHDAGAVYYSGFYHPCYPFCYPTATPPSCDVQKVSIHEIEPCLEVVTHRPSHSHSSSHCRTTSTDASSDTASEGPDSVDEFFNAWERRKERQLQLQQQQRRAEQLHHDPLRELWGDLKGTLHATSQYTGALLHHIFVRVKDAFASVRAKGRSRC